MIKETNQKSMLLITLLQNKEKMHRKSYYTLHTFYFSYIKSQCIKKNS